MTDYVLEILDGERAGDTLPLREERLRIGRHPDNDLVVADEKCSGKHAEVAFEEGAWVLRDLGSRNGTLLDGAKVSEVALSPFDIFQVGRIRVRFQEAGAKAPEDDLAMSTLDTRSLSGRRRSSVGTYALVALVLVAAGAAAWLQFGGGGAGPARIGQGPSEPLQVAGDQIGGVGDFESEGAGWDLRAGGLGFEPLFGEASTGEIAIEARGVRDDEGGASEGGFAIARTEDTFTVLAQEPLTVRASIATGGGGAVALRLRFLGGGQDETQEPTVVVAGDAPRRVRSGEDGSAGFVEHRFGVVVPGSVDRAQVEVLALLPASDSYVRVDDVAVVRGADGTGDDSVSTDNGWTFVAAGGAARIRAPSAPVLLEVEPITDDALLAKFAAQDDLTLAEAGYRLAFTSEQGDRAQLRCSRASDGENTQPMVASVRGVRLVFATLGTPWVETVDGSGGFALASDSVEDARLARAVFGSNATRCELTFPSAARTSIRSEGGALVFDIVGAVEDAIGFRVKFGPEADAARELLRRAETARVDEGPRAALVLVDELTRTAPHDAAAVREALSMQTAILEEAAERIAAVRERGNDALFFRAPTAQAAARAEIDAILATYGPEHLVDVAALESLRERLDASLTEIEAAVSQRHAAALRRMVDALDEAGAESLRGLVQTYVGQHYGEQPR
jgi:hypothetical protein